MTESGASPKKLFPAGTKVVLDTNIVLSDPGLTGTEFSVFLDGLPRTGIVWCLPQVVIDESEGTLARQLNEAHEKARGGLRNLERLFGAAVPLPDAAALAARARKCREELVRRATALGARVLPYPRVEHEQVMKRIVERKCPFHRKEEYRDYLLWSSIESLVRERGGPTVFVTANERDFLEGTTWHPDLVADLQSALAVPHIGDPQFAPAPARISDYAPDPFQSLRAFNLAAIVPYLEHLDDVRKALASGTHPVNLADVITETATNFIHEEDIKALILGWPPKCGHAYAKGVIVEEVDVGIVRRMTSGDLLVTALANVELFYGAELDEDDYLRFPEAREWLGEPFRADGPISGESEESLQITVECIILPHGLVRDVSLVEAHGPLGSWEARSPRGQRTRDEHDAG